MNLIKLKQSKEQVVFDKLTSISADIRDSIELLRTFFKEYLNGNDDQTHLIFTRIKSISDRAAAIREEIVSLLYGEPFLPDFKETMLNLTRALNDVIKALKDSARSLMIRRANPAMLMKIREQTLSYLAVITEASARLVLMISYLSTNVEEAIRISKEIQGLERQGDEIKDAILMAVYGQEAMDSISVMQLRDFILFLDNILDGMEEASLHVETFYITMKS
jgi:predicted phosphate transport protein (TIGR00153 family)